MLSPLRWFIPGIVISLKKVMGCFTAALIAVSMINSVYHQEILFPVFLSITIVCVFSHNFIGAFTAESYKKIVFSRDLVPIILFGSFCSNIIPQCEALNISVVPQLLVAISLTTLFSGFLVISLGYFNLGYIGRYLPLIVIEGFIAGAGLYLIEKSILNLSGLSTFSTAFFNPIMLLKVGIPMACIGAIIMLEKRLTKYNILLFLIIITTALYYLFLHSKGLSVMDAYQLKWSLRPLLSESVWVSLTPSMLSAINFNVIATQYPILITYIIYSVFRSVIGIITIESMFNTCLNFSKELKKIGAQFILSSLLFGSMGITTVSSISFNKALRGKGRSSLIIIAILFGVITFIPFNKMIFSYFPIVLINSLILYTGWKLSEFYFIKKYGYYDRIEYGLIMITAMTTVLYGFNEGLIIGIILALLLFIVHSRKAKIKEISNHEFGKIRRGKIDYSYTKSNIIEQEKAIIYCIYLHGNIFFGNCFNIFFIVRDLFKKHNQTDCYIVLNFKHVTGIDISAVNYFKTISFLVTSNKQDIVLSNIPNTILEKMKHVFKNNRVPFKVFENNDLAIKNIYNIVKDYSLNKCVEPHQYDKVQVLESHWK